MSVAGFSSQRMFFKTYKVLHENRSSLPHSNLLHSPPRVDLAFCLQGVLGGPAEFRKRFEGPILAGREPGASPEVNWSNMRRIFPFRLQMSMWPTSDS